MSLLNAQGIEKTFRNGDEETRVLKGIDMTLEAGELVALLGQSGSGRPVPARRRQTS